MQNPNHQPNLNLGHLREWTAALRSDAFKQGTGRLFKIPTQQFCCLGVGSKIAGLPFHEDDACADFGAGIAYPPDEFNAWLGLDKGSLRVDANEELFEQGEPGQYESPVGGPYMDWELASLNDEGFAFNQIADLIDYFGVYAAGAMV